MGTWLLTDPKELKLSIQTALEVGYRHIDTAQVYNNEFEIGKILRDYPIERTDLFITTKIAPVNYLYHVRESLEESLNRLQVDYLDLVLLHVELENDDINLKAFSQLMSLQKEGKIKHIGVSNFSIHGLKNIKVKLGVNPYCNQIVFSPTTRSIELEEYCKSEGIKLTGYSILKPYFEPNLFYPGSALSEDEKNLLDKLCQKYQVNIGQLLNSWAVLHDYHIIPKSSNPNRVKDNFHLISSISKQDMKLIDSMNHFSTDEYKKLVRQWDKNSSEEKEKLFEKVLLYKEHF